MRGAATATEPDYRGAMPAGPRPSPAGRHGTALRIARAALDARAKPLPERARLVAVVVAFGLFLGAGIWAWVNRPETDLTPNWWLLLLALALSAPGLLLKAAEYSTAARIIGQRPPLRDSVEISVVSSAANLLPIPGSFLVTIHALSEAGSSYGTALASTTAVSITWVGVTSVYGGMGVAAASGPLWVAAALAAAGGTLLVVAWRMIAVQAGRHATPRLWARAVVVESAFVVNATARFWLILRAIGVSATVAQSVSLTIAATLANALAFFPGGLGIREVIAAAISPLVSLEPEAGLLMAVLDRLMWLSVLAVAATLVVGHRRRASRAAAAHRVEEGMMRA